MAENHVGLKTEVYKFIYINYIKILFIHKFFIGQKYGDGKSIQTLAKCT